MMSLLKVAVLLLLPQAVSTDAEPEDCSGLNKTVPTTELHKVMGDWVLVWSVSDCRLDIVENLTSSHVELRLLPDNSNISYIERNRFIDNSCMVYNGTLEIPGDHHKLNVGPMTRDVNGVVKLFNESAKVEFLETCPDCMVMTYRGKMGNFLLIYRREGHHLDIEKTAENHNDFQKLAKCLDIPLEGGFIYKGAEDFCHKSPPPKQS